jgi:hypothetical protein
VTFFVHQLPLVQTFFIHEANYEEVLANEINFLVENNYSYTDVVYNIPVYMRKRIMFLIFEKYKKMKEEKEKAAGYNAL